MAKFDKCILANDSHGVGKRSCNRRRDSNGQARSKAVLQAVTVIGGPGAMALMLWFPHIEGRNANSTAFEVYFEDPFLAYVYVGSIARCGPSSAARSR